MLVSVLGAGVSGLTTALLLQRAGYRVTVFARHLPGDSSVEFASLWAGASIQTFATNDDLRHQGFDRVSFARFGEMLATPEAGLMVTTATELYDMDDEDILADPWRLSLSELPSGAKAGVEYSCYTLNVPQYLEYLQTQFLQLGGKIIRHSVQHLFDLIPPSRHAPAPSIIINCTGLGARHLGGVLDSNMFSTRGQTVLVRAPKVKGCWARQSESHLTYIIPRNNGQVILGGVMEEGSYDPAVNEETKKGILKRCVEACPDLQEDGKVDIIRDNVGFRPSRKGGVRVEVEWVKGIPGSGPNGVLIGHNYGHGGAGYQSSWGTAEELVRLIDQALKSVAAKL